MNKQRGFALIQVLLVFAVLSVVVGKMQYDFYLQLERTKQTLFLSQAQAYAESAEAIASVGLALDFELTDNDHFYEQWNMPDTAFPVDENTLIELEMNDLQGRFNLNWLTLDNEKRDTSFQALKKLLTLIGSDVEIANELINWFDGETAASDYAYMDEVPSYAPSYRAMSDISELLLLNSVDRKTFKNISKYFSTLPFESSLNVNTAPIEVLQSIASFISVDVAQSFIDAQGETGYQSIDDFMKSDIFANENKDKALFLDNLSVSSRWFELFTSVTLDKRTLTQRCVLNRSGKNVTLTSRDRSATESNRTPGDPVKSEMAQNNPATI